MKSFTIFAAALVAVVAAESRADACGGCIHPDETTTVVTDHRMVVSISQQGSTLYDQIRYSGNAATFAWILPYAGDVQIGVSADIVFGVLDTMTSTQVYAPPASCPAIPPSCPPSFGFADAGAFPGGANVLARDVVGPYEVVKVEGGSADVITWANSNGFVVPDSATKVLAAYDADGIKRYVLVKLKPGAGVQDMRPIRVTTPGAMVSLPLRMVSVGAGANVGITLWAIAEGRVEPTNFGFFSIRTEDLIWDWNANKSNYLDLRTAQTTAGKGRVWEIESSITAIPNLVRANIMNGSGSGTGAIFLNDGGRTAPDYEATATQTAEQVRDDDLATLFKGLSEQVRITRMRADLAQSGLNADLNLGAAKDQSELSNIRMIENEANEPQCPVYRDCQVVGTAPRSQAAGQTAQNPNGDAGPIDTGFGIGTRQDGGPLGSFDGPSQDDGCSSTTSKDIGMTWLALAGSIGLLLSRRRRGRST